MGNNVSTSLAALPTSVIQSTLTGPASASYLAELGQGVQYERSIGPSRFLKAIKARHQRKEDGLTSPIVVKVFVKPDGSVSLKSFTRKLIAERDTLQDVPNVLPYQKILETEHAGYLVRQWLASSLYDRISTRPFLSLLEKKWIAYQLLIALRDVHERKIAHGDIKSENILVTSSLWVYLTDFAPFKPVELPLDDPSDFSYYFDTSGRRTCYLAPERFYTVPTTSARDQPKPRVNKDKVVVSEAMDLFSLGCVLAELFCDGVPPFSLSQLFRYRSGDYVDELDGYLGQIEDPSMQTMIRYMVSLAPSARLTCTEHLSADFPPWFEHMHAYVSTLNDLTISLPMPVTGEKKEAVLRSDADERLERLSMDWETLVELLGQPEEGSRKAPKVHDVPHQVEVGSSYFPLRLGLPGFEISLPIREEGKSARTDDGAALLLLSIISSCSRSAMRPSSVLRSIDMLLYISLYLTDDTNLDRLLPCIVYLLQDDVAAVRAEAVRALTQILLLVDCITPSNATMFTDYLMENLRPLINDSDDLVRMTYVQCLASLAECGMRFLSMLNPLQDGSMPFVADREELEEPAEMNYDAKKNEIHALIQEQVIECLLADSSPVVRRALVQSVAPLCIFFGRTKSSDVLLSHMITFLNDGDWMLRASFFECAVDIASCVGGRSVDEYIFPLMLQALHDPEEMVTHRVLTSLNTMIQLGLLQKNNLWDTFDAVFGLVCHPNVWIRRSTAAILSSVARSMPHSDVWCCLFPALRRLLRADLSTFDAIEILRTAEDSLSRVIFEAAVAWAAKADSKSTFWRSASELNSARGTGLLPASMQKNADKEVLRSDEDASQLDKLRQLGLSNEDEIKLECMRDHIARLAVARKSNATRQKEASSLSVGNIALQNHGVTPQTIFYSAGAVKDDMSASLGRMGLARTGSARPALGTLSPVVSSSSLDPSAGTRAPSRSFSESNTAMEDLRKRLMQGSIHNGPAIAQRGPLALTPTSGTPHPEPSHRPASASPSSESAASFSTLPYRHPASRNSRPASRVSSTGVAVDRVVPAIGQDLTTAQGQINSDAYYRMDEDQASAMSTPGPPGSTHRDQKPYIGQRFATTYEGHDPSIRQLLERTYLDTYRELLPEFGPVVLPGSGRRRSARAAHHVARESSGHPEGILIAHLHEHSASISIIVVSPDNCFFVTASDDATVKVWDAARLEKNVASRSRQTIQLDSPTSALCMLENSHCFATASRAGDIKVYRVDVGSSGSLPRYGKQSLIRQYAFEEAGEYAAAMLHYSTDTESLLVCGTSTSRITVLDLRSMRVTNSWRIPKQYGPITSLCIDRKRVWLVTGTAVGYLCLWDLRFGILLRAWHINPRFTAQCIKSLSLHPTKGKGRWIIVCSASDNGQSSSLSVWDVSKGKLAEEFRIGSAGPAEDSTAFSETELSAPDAIKAFLKRSGKPQDVAEQSEPAIEAFFAATDFENQMTGTRSSGVNAPTSAISSGELVSADGSSAGYIVTGGDDLKLRYWDLGAIESSLVYSSPEDVKPRYSSSNSGSEGQQVATYYEEKSPPPNTRHRSTMIAQHQQQMLRAHQESITAISALSVPFNCVVSGDRSGVIKVYQ